MTTEKETLTKRMYRLMEKVSGEQQGAPKTTHLCIDKQFKGSTHLSVTCHSSFAYNYGNNL